MAFLARAPYDNVYLHSLIEAGRGRFYLAGDAAGDICGVLHDGPNLVFAVGRPEDADAFSASSLGGRSTRMIVGPRAAVERFWLGAKGRFPSPTVVRTSQPVYALTRDGISAALPPAGPFDVGIASLDELDELALHGLRMAAGEFGAPPPARVDSVFRGRTANTISAGRFWRARRGGTLLFQCYVGATTAQTAQIQGVWAPPERRGKGDATLAFAAICKALLATHPTLSLYVNNFNTRAIAMYERIGFSRVSEFASLIF